MIFKTELRQLNCKSFYLIYEMTGLYETYYNNVYIVIY